MCLSLAKKQIEPQRYKERKEEFINSPLRSLALQISFVFLLGALAQGAANRVAFANNDGWNAGYFQRLENWF